MKHQSRFNPVAKFAPKFNRSKCIDAEKHKYNRKVKHKGREMN